VQVSATEAPDTAVFTIGLRQRVQVAASEGPDTASFTLAAKATASLAATEAPDIAFFVVDLPQVVSLAATEGPDVASFAVAVSDTTVSVVVAASEAPDVASFSVEAEQPDIPWDRITKQRIVRKVGPRRKSVQEEMDELLEGMGKPSAPPKVLPTVELVVKQAPLSAVDERTEAHVFIPSALTRLDTEEEEEDTLLLLA